MEYVLSIIGLPNLGLKGIFSPVGVFAQHIHDHFIPNHRNNYHPHVLGHRSLALMSGMLVALKIFTLTALSLGPIAPAFSSAITEQNIINLTNQSRQSFGLSSLTQNSLLDQAAQAKANDMLAKGYFAHNTPDGRTPWSFIVASGYVYLMAGENLAVNFTEAENVEDAWMNSPGHKANILNKNFEQIGIGISQGQYQDHAAIFVVQMFGTPAEQSVALSDQPTAVQQQVVPKPQPAVAAPALAVPNPLPQAAAKPSQTQAKTLGESQKVSVQSVSLESGKVSLANDNLVITATTNEAAVKVLAYFGQQAIMLTPKEQNQWSGQVPLSQLSEVSTSVRLKAFSIDGKSEILQLADFSPNTRDNYNLAGTTPTTSVSVMGYHFNPKIFESRFYLFFIAGILSSLLLAIAIRKHIQHVYLIANSSFVVILAILLWSTG